MKAGGDFEASWFGGSAVQRFTGLASWRFNSSVVERFSSARRGFYRNKRVLSEKEKAFSYSDRSLSSFRLGLSLI